MSNIIQLTSDDIFILGNVCGAAVSAGKGAEVKSILTCLQQERPANAGGFIMEAIHLQGQGRVTEALEVLVQSNALSKEVNSEEATALFALLLVEDRQYQRAYDLAKSILVADEFASESARESLRTLVHELEKDTVEGTH